MVTDAVGCTATASKTLIQPDELTLSLNGTDPRCNGDATTITSNVNGGAPDYTYAWSNGETTANITVSPTVSTTYTLTVTDASSCMVSAA